MSQDSQLQIFKYFDQIFDLFEGNSNYKKIKSKIKISKKFCTQLVKKSSINQSIIFINLLTYSKFLSNKFQTIPILSDFCVFVAKEEDREHKEST